MINHKVNDGRLHLLGNARGEKNSSRLSNFKTFASSTMCPINHVFHPYYKSNSNITQSCFEYTQKLLPPHELRSSIFVPKNRTQPELPNQIPKTPKPKTLKLFGNRLFDMGIETSSPYFCQSQTESKINKCIYCIYILKKFII